MANRFEVELKARVPGFDEIEKKLVRAARPAGGIDFCDTYFCPGETEGYTYQRFRLRESPDRAVVTLKKSLPGNRCETSQELEFEVSDPAAFSEFVIRLGFKVFLRKQKFGRKYLINSEAGSPEVNVELVTIAGLGDFVEIEALVERPQEMEEAGRRVRKILFELGVEETAIEPRPYTLLLYSLKERS